MATKIIDDPWVEKKRKRLIEEAGHDDESANQALAMYIDDLMKQEAGAQLKLSQTQMALLGFPEGYGEQGQAGATTAAMFAGPYFGGQITGGLGARAAASPRLAKAVEGFFGPATTSIPARIGRRVVEKGIEKAPLIGEMAGIGAGDVAARAATGIPQDLNETAFGMLLGGLVGGGTRATSELMASGGEVPRMAAKEMSVPYGGVLPRFAKLPAPRTAGQGRGGISAESRLQARAWNAMARAEQKSPFRLQKERILQRMEAEGVRIDPEQLITKMEKMKNSVPWPEEIASHAKKIDAEIIALRKLAEEAGGSFTPTQWDTIMRNLGDVAWTASGEKSTAGLAKMYRQWRTAGRDIARKKYPKEVAELDAKAAEYMDNLEDARHFWSQDRTGIINRLRVMSDPGRDDEIRSLMWLAKAGGDKNLHLDAVRLSGMHRQYTTDIRGVERGASPGKGGGVFKTGLQEAGQRFVAPFQHFTGPTAAGILSANPDWRKGGGDIMREDIVPMIERGGNLMEAGVPLAQQSILQLLEAIESMGQSAKWQAGRIPQALRGSGRPDERDIHLRGNIP